MSIADKLTTIAENVPKVYERGRKDECDEFWDSFQEYGNRTVYRAAFSKFKNEIFKPKYDIVFPNYNTSLECARLFYECDVTGSYTQILKDLGITIDFSRCTVMQETFASCSFSEITVYAPLAKSGYGTFSYAWNLEELNLTVSDDFAWEQTLYDCYKLKTLILGCTITKNGFSTSLCRRLSKISIENIINALSSTTSKLTVTLSKTAVDKAFETSEGTNDGSTSQEWSELEATKTNWTISLA